VPALASERVLAAQSSSRAFVMIKTKPKQATNQKKKFGKHFRNNNMRRTKRKGKVEAQEAASGRDEVEQAHTEQSSKSRLGGSEGEGTLGSPDFCV
jgi:hypothetical protein